jgi:hypothetical protein
VQKQLETVIELLTDLNWAMHILFNGHLVVAVAFYVASYFAVPGPVLEQVNQIALVSFGIATACLFAMFMSTTLVYWTRRRLTTTNTAKSTREPQTASSPGRTVS